MVDKTSEPNLPQKGDASGAGGQSHSPAPGPQPTTPAAGGQSSAGKPAQPGGTSSQGNASAKSSAGGTSSAGPAAPSAAGGSGGSVKSGSPGGGETLGAGGTAPAGDGPSAAKAGGKMAGLGKDMKSQAIDGAVDAGVDRVVGGDPNSAKNRYAKGAARGAAKGAASGGAHGAAVGAVTGAGKEALGDTAGKAAERLGWDSAKDKDKDDGPSDDDKGEKSAKTEGLGAGGTGPAGPTEGEGTEKKMALGAGATAAMAPAAGNTLVMMIFLAWLAAMAFKAAAMAQTFAMWLWSAIKAIGAFLYNSLIAPLLVPFQLGASVISAIGSAVFGAGSVAASGAAGAATMSMAVVASIGVAAAGVGGSVIGAQGSEGVTSGPSRCIVQTDGGPVTVGDIDPTTEAHAQAVYKVFSGMGMPDENIAGILGNWSVESDVDPTAVEGIFDEKYEVGPKKESKVSGGTGFGIGLGQWTADRNSKLKNYAEAHGGEWYDMEVQLTFMTDPDGDNPSDVAIIKGMISDSKGSPEEATKFFLESWERAGVPALSARQKAAKQWYEKMDGWESGSSSDVENVSSGTDNSEDSETTSLDLGAVKPHVQDAAEKIYAKFEDGPGSGLQGAGGYRDGASSRDKAGHPDGLAVDFMVANDKQGKKTGDELSKYVIEHADEYNVKYVIWYQRIWNVEKGDTEWRDMEDRGDDTQNHKDHPHVSFMPSDSVTDVDPPSAVSCEKDDGSGSGGSTGNVSLEDGGLDKAAADKLMNTYNDEGDAVLRKKFGGGGPGQCNGSYVRNCVSFSWYFITKFTNYDGEYVAGNGKDVAGNFAGAVGKKTSDTPTPYSIFSHANSSAAGHTGIVLGVEGDRILIGEAAYCGFEGRARWVEASEWQNAGWSFTDVSDMLDDSGELEA